MQKQTKKIKGDRSKKTVKSQNYSSDRKTPIWCFNKIDRNGKFAFNRIKLVTRTRKGSFFI